MELAETIKSAIDRMNVSPAFNVRSRNHATALGQLVANSVTAAIREGDVILFDITYFDMDVMFALGYSIARDKPVALTLNSTHALSGQHLKRLSPISEISRLDYENSYELESRLSKALPIVDPKNWTPKRLSLRYTASHDKDDNSHPL